MIRVIDASVIAAVVFPGQRLPEANWIVADREVKLAAPTILRGEVFHSAVRLLRRRSLSEETLRARLATFDSLPFEYGYEHRWVDRALELALRYGVGVFDAIYLACAEDLDAELWTADRRFVAAFGGQRPPLLRLCPDDVNQPVPVSG